MFLRTSALYVNFHINKFFVIYLYSYSTCMLLLVSAVKKYVTDFFLLSCVLLYFFETVSHLDSSINLYLTSTEQQGMAR